MIFKKPFEKGQIVYICDPDETTVYVGEIIKCSRKTSKVHFTQAVKKQLYGTLNVVSLVNNNELYSTPEEAVSKLK